MPCLVHRVKLIAKVIMVSPSRRQLLLHLFVVDFKGCELELVLICFGLENLSLFFKLVNEILTLAVDLVKANHFTLVLL